MKQGKKSALILAAALGMTTLAGVGAQSAQAATTNTVKQQNKYLVVFKQQSGLPTGSQEMLASLGAKVTQVIDKLGAVEVTTDNPNFVTQVRSNSLVQAAGTDRKIYPEQGMSAAFEELDVEAAPATTHDLYETYQWDIKQVTKNGAAWNLQGGTGTTKDGKEVIVGVIDTGIDYNHPDIKDNYLYGKSFVPGLEDPMDEAGHGTHVAGSIAGKGRVMGIGPDLKVAAYRVFGPTGGADTADIARALTTAADDNVDVVNMSLGGYVWIQDPTTTPKEAIADLQLFNRAVDYAIKKGVTVVGSAGNNNVNISNPFSLTQSLFGEDAKGTTFRSPTNLNMIRVASNGEGLNRAFYSNYGVGMISVSAPGGDYGKDWSPEGMEMPDLSKRCLSTLPGGGYGWSMGTSMAAPKAAGLAGLIIAHYGKDKLTPAQVALKMSLSATDINKPGYDAESGFGLINAVKALQ